MQIHTVHLAALCRSGSADGRVNMDLTHELGRFSTLKGALFAIGGALGEHEMGGVDVVFVRQAAVHGLTGDLFVPLPICTCYRHRRIRLENKTRITHYSLHHNDMAMQSCANQRGRQQSSIGAVGRSNLCCRIPSSSSNS